MSAVLGIVAEQTGYPADMLDPDWIWRPTLGSTRSSRPRCSRRSASAYGIERDDALKLRDYPTLRHVVAVRDRRAGAAEAPPAPAAEPWPRPAAAACGRACRRRTAMSAVLEIVAEQTGYPADMLDPDLDLEADLGIDTVKQAEMFAAIRERLRDRARRRR